MGLTVKEIALRSGVSPATVSRILNGAEAVSDEKRRKVLAVLDREPPTGRTRKTRSGKNIGILLLPGSEQDARSVVSKLDAILCKLPQKWNLLLLPTDLSPYQLESRFLRGELAGVLIAGHGDCDETLTRVLKEIPHVWLNSRRLHGEGETVLMGNEFAGRLAGRHLLNAGVSRPAVLDVPSRNPGIRSRIDGFRFEFFAAERSFEKFLLPGTTCFEELSSEKIENLLEQTLPHNSFDGIFVPEERLTALLHRVLNKRGTPHQHWPILVSCNYTAEYLAGLYPRPASIDLGARMVAELAISELMHRISGEEVRPDNVATIVTPQLIPGDSPVVGARGGASPSS